MYQEDISPPSSFPGMPPGVSDQSCVWISLTTSCVCDGAWAKSYSQGTSTVGSSPIQQYLLDGPAFSVVKKLSRRATAVELPPIWLKRPARSKGTIQEYWAESPSWKPLWLVGENPSAQLPFASRGWTYPLAASKTFSQFAERWR